MTRLFLKSALVFTLVVVAASCNRAAHKDVLGDKLFEKASSSLSPFRFGTADIAQLRRLREGGDLPCNGDYWIKCSLSDNSGVAHSLYDDALVVKMLEAKDGQKLPLGIGLQREKSEVITAVNIFLAPKRLKCIGIAEDECFAELGTGSVRLEFRKSGELRWIRLDKWSRR